MRFNVLDMEDGLSAGSGTIAALSLWMISAGDWALVTAGALTGYLLHNFHPARILMGDTGSLLIGFLLSSMAISVANHIGGLMGVIGPLIALGLPIFEAVFISAMRFAKGRSIVRASRDHVAQRLIQRGLSVRAAVALMWLAGIVLGSLGPRVRPGTLAQSRWCCVSRHWCVEGIVLRGYGRRWM